MKKHTGKRNEDYLETIYLLSKEKRVIRIKDIAEKLDVRKSTVVSMVDKLADDEYLIHEKYGDVFLTPSGVEKAEEIYKKHLTILSFLKDVLDIPEATAEYDACNLEHYTSDITIDRLLKFIEFYFYSISKNESWQTDLKKYITNREYSEIDKNKSDNFEKLASLEVGEKATILSVRNEESVNNTMLSCGLRPGAEIKVVDKDTIKGIMSLEVDSDVQTFNYNDLKNIDIEKTKP